MYLTGYDLYDLVMQQTSKQLPSGEYLCICPECQSLKGYNYNKAKLYITSDFTVGHCFVCENTFIAKKDSTIVRPLDALSIANPTGLEIKYEGAPTISQESLAYLRARCPALYNDVDFQELGFLPIAKKIIIRFLLGIKEYYYQIRYLHPEENGGNRYYSPPVLESGKPIYITGGKFDASKPTVLVEGVFTALTEWLLLKGNANVLAMLGHTLSKFQLAFLQSLGCYGQLFVHMDTTAYSADFLKKLKKSYPTANLIPSYSNSYDSEEIISKGILPVESYNRYLQSYMQPQVGLCVR